MKFGILLSGCGVYDGAEIQEAVLTMLAIEEIGASYQCIGVNSNQHHVINHITGEPMNETRNMLVEAARIARGSIIPIEQAQPADFDALVIPGGFGSAKNFTSWAFSGADGDILPEVKLLLVNMVNVGKPIVALCVSPVVVAKAFEDTSIHPRMTLGTTAESSPYDIEGFSQGLKNTGVDPVMSTISEIVIDKKNRIISAPCYMMNASLLEVRKNIRQAIEATRDLIE